LQQPPKKLQAFPKSKRAHKNKSAFTNSPVLKKGKTKLLKSKGGEIGERKS